MTTLPVFDTHAHLDLVLDEMTGNRQDNQQKLFQRLESGIFPDNFIPKELNGCSVQMTGVVLPGTDAASSCRCIELAAVSPLFHSAVGIHPNHIEHWFPSVAAMNQNRLTRLF
ncbi:hypothetical protein FACS189427_13650 [Planctomycetales bacterium]|nr:hypothetical protein FACS189427_13650 [Planctomycetales bacterium]